MIKENGTYDEIKDSVIETLGWTATGLCLEVIKTLHEIDCWVWVWTNNDDPRDVYSHVNMYLSRPPEDIYAALKSVLREYDLEFDQWEHWKLTTEAVPVNVPDQCKWAAILSFRSKHEAWTENDPPPGGQRSTNGWTYNPHPYPNALIWGIPRR